MTPFKRLTAITAISLALILAACAGTGGQEATFTPIPEPSPTAAAGGLQALLDALRAAGATVVETGDQVEQPFLSPMGQIVQVNGTDVQFFVYDSEEKAVAEAGEISPNGGSTSTSVIEWIATPHFFRLGEVIALYVGDDEALLSILEEVMGEEFAGGAPIFLPPTPAAEGTPSALPLSCAPEATFNSTYVNTEVGYCLLFPEGFVADSDDPKHVTLSSPPVGEGPEPASATLQILALGSAGDQSLTQTVDAVVNQYDLILARTEGMIGGQPAEIVEGLPGTSGSRQAWVIHNGQLFQFIVQPIGDPSFAELEPEAERVWQMLVETFAFLPAEG
jgi:hypothetical protein